MAAAMLEIIIFFIVVNINMYLLCDLPKSHRLSLQPLVLSLNHDAKL